jgi:hypothetical protein
MIWTSSGLHIELAESFLLPTEDRMMISPTEKLFRNNIKEYETEIQRLEDEITALGDTPENALRIRTHRQLQQMLQSFIDRLAENIKAMH